MEDGGIQKDLLYGELATGSRPAGRLLLRLKDTCMRLTDISIKGRETVASGRDPPENHCQEGHQESPREEVLERPAY